MFVVVCYDIADNKRRNKAYKTLEAFGSHAQESVFECDITPKQLQKLRERLKAVIKEKEDCLRYYILCEECVRRIEVVGLGVVEKTKEFYLV